jgi:hypothetical protein
MRFVWKFKTNESCLKNTANMTGELHETKELANAAKFLFSAKEDSFENLKTVFGSDRKWSNSRSILGSKNSVDLNNGEQLRNFVN